MKNRIFLSLSMAGLISGFSGCTATTVDEFARKYSPDNVKRMAARSMSGQTQSSFISGFSDPVLAKEFAEFYDKEGYSLDYSTNTFNIKKQLVYFSENVYLGQADAYIANNSGENEFSKKYKETIVKKGNSYKILTGDFNKELMEIMIGGKIPEFSKAKMQYVKTNLIPAIAEFDKNNDLVSIMLNTVFVGAAFDKVRNPNVQSEIMINVAFFTGSTLNKIKNNVAVRKWEEHLIKSSN